MGSVNTDRIIIHFYICMEQYIRQGRPGIADQAAVDNRVPGKNNGTVKKTVAIRIEGKIKIRIAEFFLYRCYIIIKIREGGGMKFLQAKHIGILLFDEVKHFKSCLASFVIIPFHFNKPVHIPGSHPYGPRFFFIIKCTGPVKSEKNNDAFKTQQENKPVDKRKTIFEK